MVGCDNPGCPYQWFHLECLRLKSVPIDQNHDTFKTVAKMRSSKRVNKSMTILYKIMYNVKSQ